MPEAPPHPSPLSTTSSQFDITATEPDLSEDTRRKLSVTQEGGAEATPPIKPRGQNVRAPARETDCGYSPTTNFTIRSPSGEEETAALTDVIRGHLHKGGPGGGDDRSFHSMQRLADE